jgi:hypothetical protein
VNSAQGKVSWDLAEVRGMVVGGEKGPDKAWEGRPPSRYFSGASVLSLALC